MVVDEVMVTAAKKDEVRSRVAKLLGEWIPSAWPLPALSDNVSELARKSVCVPLLVCDG